MTGPRAYSSGTEKALFALASGTCYFPNCPTPIVVFVEGRPANNVQICHIRGAYPGAARYDAQMSDDARASFDNLLLLCKPHHDLVDKLAPDDYPVKMLREWKVGREGSTTAELRQLSGLDDDRLEELLRDAVKSAVGSREVTIETLGGLRTAAHGWVTVPLSGLRAVRDANRTAFAHDLALAVKLRNRGGLTASVESVTWYLGPDAPRSERPEITLLGRNDYPALNPDLPVTLASGASTTWLTAMGTLRMMRETGRTSGVELAVLRVEAQLGTGETIASEDIAVSELPIDDDGSQTTP